MTNLEKLSAIVDSYINGQKHQMIEQVREYGVAKWHTDLYVMRHEVLFGTNPTADYAAMVYTFQSLKTVYA